MKSADITELDAEIFIPELEDMEPVKSTQRRWTDYELAILRKYYGKIGPQKLAEYFATDEKCVNRSRLSVLKKASELGIPFNV